LKGRFEELLDPLLRRASLSGRRAELFAALSEEIAQRYVFAGRDVAIPHLRIEGLSEPELVLAISRRGIRINGRRARIVLLLATPAEQAALHLQLLQRLSALLPEVAHELLRARTASRVLQIIAHHEEFPGRATYLNLTQEQVAFELRTDLDRGLAGAEAAARLARHGPNRLRRARPTPWPARLARSLFSFFAILLWVAALACFLPGVDMPQLGVAILLVVSINGMFSFLQEYKSDRAVEALQQLLSQKTRVIREGQLLELDAATLVPGDIVVLEEGDIVPADCRLIEALEVEVDNSTLTGESTSAKRYKSDQPLLIPGKFLWIELPNIVFAGTALVRGRARAVVFGTGMRSEIGQIAGLTQQIRMEPSPLQKQLGGAVLIIAALAFTLGAAFLLLGWLVAGLTFVQAFIFFIGLFVANVPEGLLPTVTLALAMGVTRMAKRNALVKSLPSVETLGCTTVICCDKTGTLTQNLMMVSEILVDGEVVEVSGTGYEPRGELKWSGRALSLEEISSWAALGRLLQCAFTCNNARLEKTSAGYRVIGDPTEGALMALAQKARLQGVHHRLQLNPFESVRKRMSVVVRAEGQKQKTVYAKGAPLEVLERCNRILRGGEVRELDEPERSRIRAENDALAARGLRILALAYRDDQEIQEESSYEAERVERNLVFLGLTAMTDPVRPEVPEAIRACHSAGIRVIMITGDYALTAASIGREIGLGAGAALPVHSGAEVSQMGDDALREALRQGEVIFARVAPEHKLRVVSLLKEMGEIVAATGDGVNDAPALKKAHIGIAMGLRGNDVAKEAADMILTDDNFSSVVAAIEEGRGIFDNIKRFVAYILNSNPQELYPYIVWMLFPELPLAMTVMGVLAVDVGTDLIPAMGLGIEPPESGIMERPPRRLQERLVSLRFILRSYLVQGSLLAGSCYATYFYCGWLLGFWRPGLPASAMPASPAGLNLAQATPAYLQSLTAYFFPTVTAQIGNVLSKRSWKTSLFSRDFLSPKRRQHILQSVADWRPRRPSGRVHVEVHLGRLAPAELSRFLLRLASALALLPFRLLGTLASEVAGRLDRPLFRPLARGASRFFEKHFVVLNLVSNPLIDLGIAFELLLCYLFFYTPLARVYYFAPVPWQVYAFALHGTVLLLAFEETKKYLRRRGLALDFLG
jgi:magnesium-transporting ATPase (P-type)